MAQESDDVRQAVERALEAVEDVPEDLRPTAYRTVLEHLLRQAAPPVEPPGDTSPPADRKPSVETGGQVAPELSSRLPDEYAVSQGTRRHQAAWAVVVLSERGQEATTSSVRDAIRVELGETPEGPQHTSNTLKSLTPEYLSRRRRDEGQGFAYEPKENVLEVFDDLDA